MLEPDKLALEELKAVGVDLNQPVEVLHYFYVGEKDAAEAAASKISNMGFHVVVQPAALGDNWLILAKRTQIVNQSAVAELRRFFEQIATTTPNAEYDGWEVAING